MSYLYSGLNLSLKRCLLKFLFKKKSGTCMYGIILLSARYWINDNNNIGRCGCYRDRLKTRSGLSEVHSEDFALKLQLKYFVILVEHICIYKNQLLVLVAFTIWVYLPDRPVLSTVSYTRPISDTMLINENVNSFYMQYSIKYQTTS